MPWEQEPIRLPLEKALSAGKLCFETLLECVTSGGSQRILSCRIQLLRNNTGEATEAALPLLDVTEQKRIAAEHAETVQRERFARTKAARNGIRVTQWRLGLEFALWYC